MIRDPLRANQTDVLHRAIAAVNRGKNPCIVSPTGTGKTVVAAAVIKSFPERFVLVISDRRTIIGQTKDSFSELDISAGAIMAGVAPDHMRRVQVASAQSFRARYLDGKQALPPVGLILHDECHHAPARTHRRIREAYPGVPVVGFTATPVRSDDRGLGSYFDVLIEAPQVQQQINLGFLVPTLVYAPVRPDLDRVHVRCGEYVEGELAEVMAKLIGNVTHDWCKFGEDRRTISFAVNRAHARAIEIAFNQIGVRAEYIDGSTSLDERDAIFGRLERGVTKVVSTCEAISEGWNLPCVSCCILAKPTKSLGTYIQKIGRVLRPWPEGGKTNAIVIDHSDATRMHGRVEDPIVWTLSPDRKAKNAKQAEHDKRHHGERLVDCSNCGAIRNAGEACVNCGFMPKPPPRNVTFIDGELAQLARDGRQQLHQYSQAERMAFYRGLLHIAVSRGKNPRSAAHRYKEKFGVFPPWAWNDLGPEPPTREALAWDHHCRIRYAKSMQKVAAHG